MFLNSLVRLTCPSFFNQFRCHRPTVKIGKDKFQVTINVHQFNRDEIRVKARPEYVLIEGKQERKTKRGYVIRQFARKFKLPPGCRPELMESKLSPEGTLTIIAPRETCEMNFPCETRVPISFTESKAQEDSIIPLKEQQSADHCKNLLDGKPKSG